VKKLAVVFATVFALVGGSMAFSTPATLANCDPNVPTVVISGGSVSNATTIDLNADAGTAIGDASGGDDNIAFELVGGEDGFDVTAAAGNGGTSDSSANGGAIAVGDVNSGGNVGNVIEVGDTTCAPAPAPEKPVDEKKPAPAAKPAPAGKAAASVAALPSTGTGVAGDVNFGFIALALVGAVAAAGYSVRARFN
jgi:hypothetical protein